MGRRTIDHELRGVPGRVELGPRDLAANQAVVARRVHTEKQTVALRALFELPRKLADDQKELLVQATALRAGRTRPARSIDEAREIASEGSPVFRGEPVGQKEKIGLRSQACPCVAWCVRTANPSMIRMPTGSKPSLRGRIEQRGR